MASVTFTIILLSLINIIDNKTVQCGDGNTCSCGTLSNGETCTFDCRFEDKACRDGRLTCTTGHACIIDCSTDRGCESARVTADTATDVTIICQSGGGDECASATFDCGTGICTMDCSGSCNSVTVDVQPSTDSFQCSSGCPTPVTNQERINTPSPTPSPTNNPTPSPTNNPTPSPTNNPTPSPTSNPTPAPTSNPTHIPTNNPSHTPTNNPTNTIITTAPSTLSNNPSIFPTKYPTLSPTKYPTLSPTNNPVSSPPTKYPTITPTKNPIKSSLTINPTKTPTENPTRTPTLTPDSVYTPTIMLTLSVPTTWTNTGGEGHVGEHTIATDNNDNNQKKLSGDNQTIYQFIYVIIGFSLTVCCLLVCMVIIRKRKRDKKVIDVFDNKDKGITELYRMSSNSATLPATSNTIDGNNTTHLTIFDEDKHLKNENVISNEILDHMLTPMGLEQNDDMVIEGNNEIDNIENNGNDSDIELLDTINTVGGNDCNENEYIDDDDDVLGTINNITKGNDNDEYIDDDDDILENVNNITKGNDECEGTPDDDNILDDEFVVTPNGDDILDEDDELIDPFQSPQ